MILFNSLPTETQNQVRNSFVLPTDTSNITVDAHNRPYEQTQYGKIYCGVRNTIDSFHNYSNRQK